MAQGGFPMAYNGHYNLNVVYQPGDVVQVFGNLYLGVMSDNKGNHPRSTQNYCIPIAPF